MIKIKIEAASGADLRAQLIALLGGLQSTSTPITIPGTAIMQALERTNPPEAPIQEAPTQEEVKTEAPTKPARRTKAQIAADEEAKKNAEATAQESTTDDTPSDQAVTLEQDNADQNADEPTVTFEGLRDMVLALSREGKKEDLKKILAGFKVERLTEMTKDQYLPFYEKIKPLHDAIQKA